MNNDNIETKTATLTTAASAKPIKPAGTPLRDDDIKKRKVCITEWKPKLDYIWSAGVGISYYLHSLKEGKIMGRYCRSCRRTLVPPRMFCEECFRPTDKWVQVRDTGTINTFAVCYIATDATRIKDPIMPSVIEIDGASPGMGIMHLIGGVKPENVKIGMKVKAVWKPTEERKGDITDIKYWTPINDDDKKSKKDRR